MYTEGIDCTALQDVAIYYYLERVLNVIKLRVCLEFETNPNKT
jgi:hypothetical protein